MVSRIRVIGGWTDSYRVRSSRGEGRNQRRPYAPWALAPMGRRAPERNAPRICRQTIFICGKPQWYSKPLKQLGFLPRQEGHSSSYGYQQRQPCGLAPNRGAVDFVLVSGGMVNILVRRFPAQRFLGA